MSIVFQHWKEVHKIFVDKDNKVSEIAGIEGIAIKIDAKVMIQWNIDVISGLVNGTIGNVVAVNRSVEIVLIPLKQLFRTKKSQ